MFNMCSICRELSSIICKSINLCTVNLKPLITITIEVHINLYTVLFYAYTLYVTIYKCNIWLIEMYESYSIFAIYLNGID